MNEENEIQKNNDTNLVESLENNHYKNKIEDKFFYLFAIFFIYLGWLIFQPFWQIIVFSIFIVTVLYPLHKKIKDKVKSDTNASFLSTFIVFLFLLIPGFIFMFVIISQMIEIFPTVTDFFSKNHDYNYYSSQIPPFLVEWYDKAKIYAEAAGINTNINFVELIKNYIGNITKFTLQQSQSILGNIGSVLVNIAFILLSLFFLFRDSDVYLDLIKKLVPMKDEDKNFLLENSAKGIRAIFLGTILTALTQGFLGFVAYFVADIKFSLFWGFSTFICSFFPLGGSAIIWFPITLYLLFTSSWLSALLMFLWGAIVITMSDNIVRPIIVGGQTNVGTLALVFSMLGGVQLFGFIGLFLAPVIVITIINILELYEKKLSN
ncbi:MAG: AI-2E family transporter [Candidatus Sericytochromatia bacterium]